MASKKKTIIIQGGSPGNIATESLPGEELNPADAIISIAYQDTEISDAQAEAALAAAVAECG